MRGAAEALRALKQQIDGTPAPTTIRDLANQAETLAACKRVRYSGVGENAFDKYERGLIEPSGPTIQLMTLLARHPELLDELR
jgi:HTH-type transcriptional regulator/antitoxin MqsA